LRPTRSDGARSIRRRLRPLRGSTGCAARGRGDQVSGRQGSRQAVDRSFASDATRLGRDRHRSRAHDCQHLSLDQCHECPPQPRRSRAGMLSAAELAVNDAGDRTDVPSGPSRALPALHDYAGSALGCIRDSPQQVQHRANRVCHTFRFGTLLGHSLATCYEAVTISRPVG
jgi:hypothetical protein